MIEGQTETITGDEMIRQPNQSISGIDGRPLTDCDGQCGGCTSHRPDELDADGESGRCDDGDQDDPVLAAIDRAKWTDDELMQVCLMSKTGIKSSVFGANRQIEAIRTAYLASKQKPTVKESLTVQPSDGGEFERKLKNLRYMPSSAKQILSDAHNSDRAADKQRIAELDDDVERLLQVVAVQNDTIVSLEDKVRQGIACHKHDLHHAVACGACYAEAKQRIAELEADKRELIKSLEWLYEVSEIPHDKDYGAATNAATVIAKHGGDA